MSPTMEIRRRPNGSIDVEHYVRIGRAVHARNVSDAAKRLGQKVRPLDALTGASLLLLRDRRRRSGEARVMP